ncbi:P1 family peptidase [Arvimicrobium flavum]|uniref:P1 family peptidase n=1 Tax=Arvimicrobium flavum TaxID=3393320 RepID=UPI00237B4B34|nr:P1 family peptidase [Mesorhizobium shangrilense]
MTTTRARSLGLDFRGAPGSDNAVTDVAGVKVGFSTLIDPERGIRTGVTALLPRDDRDCPVPAWAGCFALNGNGEMTGTHWINDAGYFFGPVLITNTHSIGMAHHGAVKWTIDRYAKAFEEQRLWTMPVVAETCDATLNDINGLHVTAEHALEALDTAASGPVAEGAVGGGAGMIAYEFKAGTGTSSRRVRIDGATYTVGALVQANHGLRPWLTVLGVPVGEFLTEGRLRQTESGSIIAIVVTDAPLSPLSLRHAARRAAIGVGRGGTPGGNSSGDLFLAISTANERPLPHIAGSRETFEFLNAEWIDPVYLAVVEAVEEGVINSLVAGRDTPTFKPPGKICRGIDHEQLRDVMRRFGRLRPAAL